MYSSIFTNISDIKKNKNLPASIKEEILKNYHPIHDLLTTFREDNIKLSDIIFQISTSYFNAFQEEFDQKFKSGISMVNHIFNYSFRKNKNNTLESKFGFSIDNFQQYPERVMEFITEHYSDSILSSIRGLRYHIINNTDFFNETSNVYHKELEETNMILEKNKTLRALEEHKKKENDVNQFFSRVGNIEHIITPLVSRMRKNKNRSYDQRVIFFKDCIDKFRIGDPVYGYVVKGKTMPIGTKIKFAMNYGRNIKLKDAQIYVIPEGQNSSTPILAEYVVFLK